MTVNPIDDQREAEIGYGVNNTEIESFNNTGTIDADYRGEIGVVLINLSQEDFVVEDGERIAQMVIARHEQADFEAVEVLDETVRGEGGYGHTGVK